VRWAEVAAALLLLAGIAAAARNDTHVWAEKYDRDLADVFAIPARIAEKSIAVLPFDNLSEEKQNAYFAVDVQIKGTKRGTGAAYLA